MELTIAYCGRPLNDDESMTLSPNRISMLKDSNKNEHPYAQSDVQKMLAKLLEKVVIEVSQSKCPAKIRRTDDPTNITGSLLVL